MLGIALALGMNAYEAKAVPLPISGVSVETYAEIDGALPWSETVSDAFAAASESNFPGSLDSQAKAQAEAQTSGPGGGPVVRARSVASDNVQNPIYASANALVTTQWVANTDGTVVPVGGTVGIDTRLSFDGVLYADAGFIQGVGASGSISAGMVLHTDAGSTVVFNSNLTVVDSMGTQFVVGGAGPFLQSYQRQGNLVTLDYEQDFLGLLSVTVGQPFALQLGLATNAFVGDVDPPGDNLGNSDFFSTGLFDLFVSTPGITLTRLDGVPGNGNVPEPSVLGLLIAGGIGLGRCTRRRPLAGSGRSERVV